MTSIELYEHDGAVAQLPTALIRRARAAVPKPRAPRHRDLVDQNLTLRFAWGFLSGLARASLRNARANEHSIECANRSELEAVVTKPHLAGEDCALMADGHGTAEIMRATGVSSAQRIWRAHGLRPHLVRPFKLSNEA